jgi:hypothetical protein
MSDTRSFKRLPAIRCWIKHLLEGSYSAEEKVLHTIFGEVKRTRIIATIVDKREKINAQTAEDDTSLDEDDGNNMRLEFDLDDGTGLIRATLWNVNPEKYSTFDKGNIVDIVGLIRFWNSYISLSPEIIKKIEDPNALLLQNAEIIKKIKSGEIQEIPVLNEGGTSIDVIPDEFDIDELFEEKEKVEINDTKELIYSIIEENSKEGISIKELKKRLEITEGELKSYIKDLEMESKIYQSEENVYQTY